MNTLEILCFDKIILNLFDEIDYTLFDEKHKIFDILFNKYKVPRSVLNKFKYELIILGIKQNIIEFASLDESLRLNKHIVIIRQRYYYGRYKTKC